MKKNKEQKEFKTGLKLGILYFLASFFAILVIVGLLFFQYRSQIVFVEKIQGEALSRTAVQVDSYLNQVAGELESAGKGVFCPGCAQANTSSLNQLLDADSRLAEISLIDLSGMEKVKIFRTGEEGYGELQNVAATANFKRAMESGRYFGLVHLSGSGAVLIDISLPVFDQDNNRAGVISAKLDLSRLGESIFKFSDTAGSLYVVDQSGRLIAGSEHGLVKNYLDVSNVAGVKSFLDGSLGFYTYKSLAGETVFGSRARIESANFGVLAELPVEDLVRENIIFIGIAGALIVIFIVLLIFSSIAIYFDFVKPLNLLREGVKKIKDGNYNYNIEAGDNNEFSYFADFFNEMSAHFREANLELSDSIKQRASDLDKVIAKLWGKNLEMKDGEAAMLNLLEDARLLEEQLKQEKDRMSTIIACMDEGLITADINGRVTYINPATERMLETTNSRVIGKSIDVVSPLFVGRECEKRVALESRPLMVAIKTGKPVVTGLVEDYYFLSTTGKKIAVSLTTSPLLQGDKIVGGIVTFRNVNVEKRLDEAKNGFISIASHQMRTPLTSMRWFSEMLISEDAGPINREQKKFIERIHEGIERLIALLNLLLQIARVEAGRVKISPTPINFKNIVQGVAVTLAPMIRTKALKIKTLFKPADFPAIPMDQEVVWQVFINLISNACRYAPDKGTITVKAEIKGKMAEFSVNDKGIGIPKDAQDRVFNKFFRAENAMKLVPEGSGLGLSLVKTLVEGWGGAIWFKSNKAVGTTFSFTVPLTGMKVREGDVSLKV